MKFKDFYSDCTGKEKHRLEEIRKAKEFKPPRHIYTNLDGNELGFELDWDKKNVVFFIFHEKKRNEILRIDPISIFAGEDAIRKQIRDLVSAYRGMIGKDPEVKMYSMIELSILASHFSFHASTGTLKRALEKEEVR